MVQSHGVAFNVMSRALLFYVWKVHRRSSAKASLTCERVVLHSYNAKMYWPSTAHCTIMWDKWPKYTRYKSSLTSVIQTSEVMQTPYYAFSSTGTQQSVIPKSLDGAQHTDTDHRPTFWVVIQKKQGWYFVLVTGNPKYYYQEKYVIGGGKWTVTIFKKDHFKIWKLCQIHWQYQHLDRPLIRVWWYNSASRRSSRGARFVL